MSKLLEIFKNNIAFDITEYLDLGTFSDFQKKAVDDATFILKENIVGEVKIFGGNLKKNEAKLKELEKKAEEELKKDTYKDSKKEMKEFLKEYLKVLPKFIETTVWAVIPVKEMPWVDIVFRSVPRIIMDKKKADLLDNAFAYYGEIKCIISRTTLYGKMKDAKPLFAPLMGELDMAGYKLDEDQKVPKPKIYPYITKVIEALDAVTTKSHLAKYHEGYQRHGEPICDFFMKDEELLKAMDKLTSGFESKRLSSDLAICGIALPLSADQTTLMLVTDESKDSGKYTKCFEGFIRFSAACCEAPSSRKTDSAAQAAQMTQAAQSQMPASGPGVGGLVRPPGQPGPQQAQPGGTVSTPGGQELKVWTSEELADDAQKRGAGGVPSGMAHWSEEELSKMASERGSGVPEGMEVWTEEDLAELSKKRQGGALNIPEWKADQDMAECTKCGYGLRKGWDECPICNTPVGAKSTPEPSKEPSEKPSADTPPETSQPSEEKKDE